MLTDLPAAKYALLQMGQADTNGNPALYFDGNALFRSCIHSRSVLGQSVSGVFIGDVLQWKEALFLDVRQVREKRGSETDWCKFLEDTKDTLAEGQEILGWYYSQPEEDIFLTEQVLAIQSQHFSDVKQFLLLLDPVLRRFGVFQRKMDYLCLIPGFKVTSSLNRGEQTKQLLHQIDFAYASQPEKPKTTVMKLGANHTTKMIQAYQPKNLTMLLDEGEIEADVLLQKLDGFREVFLSKDILVKREVRTKNEIEKMVDKILAEMKTVKIKTMIRLYWELNSGQDNYFEEHWICQIRWNGKNQTHSIVWNEEELI